MKSLTAPIIHIGLGKTGTTSLQQHLFPKLCEEKGYVYNPKEWIDIDSKRITHSDEDRLGSVDSLALKEIISNHKVLISKESLIDWNPRNWETGADRLLELFGADAKVIITIREPIGYLCSTYLQQIQEGNIVRPEEFFVASEEYEKLATVLPQRSTLRYDYEKLDYAHLKTLYEKRFKDVYFMPLSRINSLYPFDELFSLSESDIAKYSEAFERAPRENISYSRLAVRLTFLRENFFNILGMKSLGSEDVYYDNEFIQPSQDSHTSKGSLKFEELLLKHKMRDLFPRLARKIIKSWRWYMQRVLDRLYPYEKYKLPKEVLFKLESSLMKENTQFIDELEISTDQIKSLKSIEL